MNVFPTPVSVPVISNPRIEMLLELLQYHLIEMQAAEADKRYVWHPYTQMQDWKKWDNRVIVRGRGFYLIDNKGRRYLDGIASMWCNVWGHSRKEIISKMSEQAPDSSTFNTIRIGQRSFHRFS